jgi:hypothetical protein
MKKIIISLIEKFNKTQILEKSKRTKKQILKIVSITIISVLLIIWFLLNFSINLLINSSPTITIEPTSQYLNKLNIQTTTIDYNISISKPFYSDITCKYSFLDVSKNLILQSNPINIKQKLTNLNIKIDPKNQGSGKDIYNLEVLCISMENETKIKNTYEKTSFLLLTYDLTPEEKTIKEQFRPQLLFLFEDFNKVSNQSNYVNYIISNNKNLIEHNKYQITNKKLQSQFNQSYQNLQYLQKIWIEEKYTQFNINIINNYTSELNQLQNNFQTLYDNFTYNLIEQNKNVDFYNETLQNYQTLNTDMLFFQTKKIFKTTINNINLLNATQNQTHRFNQTYKSYTQNYFENNTQFKTNIIQLDKTNNKIKQTNIQIENIFISESNQIIQIENQIRCNIKNCLSQDIFSIQNNTRNNIQSNTQSNTKDKVCQNINQILSNQTFTNYNIIQSYNLIKYNNSYHNYSNQTLELINLDDLTENQTIENIIESSTFLDLDNSNQTHRYKLTNTQIQIQENENLLNFNNLYCKIMSNENITQIQNSNIFNLQNLRFLNFNSNFPTLTNIQNNTQNLTQNPKFDLELTQNLPQCCIGGVCVNCCVDDLCKQDEENYPLLLIHGHSFVKETPAEPSINSFNKISYKLIEDGFIDAGVLSFENLSYTQSNLKALNAPVTVKASYYFDSFYNLGGYVYITKKNDNIDTYAIRLSEIVNSLKISTDRPQVNIVAHSMGGLVVRRYMQIFGTESINKVILIGTPNHGVTGGVKYLCSVVGEKLECDDMSDDSILIAKLNDPNYTPKKIDLYTISGTGCQMDNGNTGDGVVSINSSQLKYATNYRVNGTCSDLFSTNMHTDLLNINKYPQVYEYIRNILVEK